MFLEMLSLFDKLVIVEGIQVQFRVLNIIKNVTRDFGKWCCDDLDTGR